MFLEESQSAPRKPSGRDLVAEADHRIANSLASVASLIHHQAMDLDGAIMTAAEVRQLLAEVKARIDAVARLHRMLSDTGSETPIDVGSYLQQIASESVATLSRRDAVTLHFVCELGCRVAPERALYMGLIIVELVTNSLKYAHPAGVHGSIAIRCRRHPDAIVIEVADDGVGLPEDMSYSSDKTSGLRLVRSLAAQIGGTMTFDSDGLGLRCVLEAPLLSVV